MPRCLPLLALACCFGCGCAAHYATPGRGANLREIAADAPMLPSAGEPSIVAAMGTQPLAHFPTGIAAVRIQAPGYESKTVKGWGEGRYSIVTTRDIEAPADLERLAKLPMVSGVGPINRLLLPTHLETDRERVGTLDPRTSPEQRRPSSRWPPSCHLTGAGILRAGPPLE